MNLLQYNNKRVRVIDIDGKEYVGMAYYEGAINFDEKEDSLTIKLDDDKKYTYFGLYESEIKSVEVIK